MIRLWPYALGALLLGALFAYHRIALSSADRAGYKRATAEMQRTIAEANAKNRLDEQAAQARANEVDHAHQKAIADLDARYAARPVPAVRLCRDTSASQIHVPTAAAAAGSDPSATGGDGLPGPAVADIGPELERLVRIADRQAQQLISCMRFAAVAQSGRAVAR